MNVLFINRSDSVCGVCGEPAIPHELSHMTRCGYNPGEGCGAVWTHVSSHYRGGGIEQAAQDTRLDLEWVDFFEAMQ